MDGLPLLSIVLFLPLAGAVLALFVPGDQPGTSRRLALVVSGVTFLVSLLLWFGFATGTASFQWEERVPWLPEYGIGYHLGIDGISILLVLLTTLMLPLVILSVSTTITTRVKEFSVMVLLMETAILGTLMALDLFLFYIFFELMLVPMYMLVGIWGGERRLQAAMKFFLFTMAGGVVMLVGIIGVYLLKGSFDYVDVLKSITAPGGALPIDMQLWLFAAFALAFAIKVPLFPFHAWLPDAYSEAPTGATVIMSAVMVKVGTYGFLRFCIPLFPTAAHDAVWTVSILATVGIVYGALVAAMQRDMKRVVAYSSISHIGFVMLGLFAMTTESLQGSVLQMLNHGVSTGALFLLVGFLHERTRTRIISDLGGIAKVMPIFAGVFTLVMFSSAGLPFTNGFVGEFLILTGTFKNATDGLQPFAIIGASGVVLSAVYLLWMYQRAMQGPVNPAFSSPDDRPSNVAGGRTGLVLADLTVREMMVLLPLAALIIWIGVYPRPFLDRTAASVEAISARMALPQTGVLASGTGARVP